MKDKPNVVQMKKRTRRDKFNLETALGRVDAYLAKTPMRDLSQFDFNPDLELGNVNLQVADKPAHFSKVVSLSNETVGLADKFVAARMLEKMDSPPNEVLFYKPDHTLGRSHSDAGFKLATEQLLVSMNAVSLGSIRATDALLSHVIESGKLLTGAAALVTHRLTLEDLSYIPPISSSEANDEFYPILDEHGFKKA